MPPTILARAFSIPHLNGVTVVVVVGAKNKYLFYSLRILKENSDLLKRI